MKFIDLFAGIGGFRLGMESAGHECVAFCEIDKFARASYKAIHDTKGETEYHDITSVTDEEWRKFRGTVDVICGGFPCQAFSVAGKRQGFLDETRGTLFFEIARAAKQIKPRILFLENVKGLLSHDKGRTFGIILNTLDELGYDCEWQVLNSKNFGVPQNRERVFIVGHRRDVKKSSVFPIERIAIDDGFEKVYWLSKGVSQEFGILSGNLSEGKELHGTEMQRLFERVQQELQTKECREVEIRPKEMDANSSRSIQVIEELNSLSSGSNNKNGICGVVQIPTEGLLLLWNKGKGTPNIEGCVQQQDVQTFDRQDRFKQELRSGESGSLLLAVQSHQGKLLYSIGNGRDWTKIYSKEVGKCKTTLSCILEENVDEKYFLSEAQSTKLLLSM